MTESEYKEHLKNIRRKLKQSRIPFVSRGTGIHDSTLRRIMDEVTKSPKIENVEILVKYFRL